MVIKDGINDESSEEEDDDESQYDEEIKDF